MQLDYSTDYATVFILYWYFMSMIAFPVRSEAERIVAELKAPVQPTEAEIPNRMFPCR